MNNIYTVETTGKGCIDMSKPGSTTLCYRMTYADLKSGKHGLDIKNPFIVYILHAKNYEGKDYLYIGKSKNGISNRPKSHENKDVNWDMCYVLTQFYERTMLNDGTIQYLEDIISDKAKETNCYNVLTQQTTKGTANKSDEINCRIFLEAAIEMLYVLGLDLKTVRTVEDSNIEFVSIEDEACEIQKISRKSAILQIPDGRYYFDRKIKAWDNRSVKGTMRVENGTFIVEKGSVCCPVVSKGNISRWVEARKTVSIIDNILQEDFVCDSPSGAGEFLCLCAVNGWAWWKTVDGDSIDKFRKAELND